MKADILRRAEEISDEEEDEDEGNGAKGKGIIVAFEDELDEGGLKVRDGEESSDGGSDDEGDDHDGEVLCPESTIYVFPLTAIFSRTLSLRHLKPFWSWRTLQTRKFSIVTFRPGGAKPVRTYVHKRAGLMSRSKAGGSCWNATYVCSSFTGNER